MQREMWRKAETEISRSNPMEETPANRKQYKERPKELVQWGTEEEETPSLAE